MLKLIGVGLGMLCGVLIILFANQQLPGSLWHRGLDLITGPSPVLADGNKLPDEATPGAVDEMPVVIPMPGSGRSVLPAEEYEGPFEPAVEADSPALADAMAMPGEADDVPQTSGDQTGYPAVAADSAGTEEPGEQNIGESGVAGLDSDVAFAEDGANTNGAENWQPLWQAFRTRVSADGFSERVAEQSGVALQVRETAFRAYHAGFLYTDETERELLLNRIAERSGLSLELLTQP